MSISQGREISFESVSGMDLGWAVICLADPFTCVIWL